MPRPFPRPLLFSIALLFAPVLGFCGGSAAAAAQVDGPVQRLAPGGVAPGMAPPMQQPPQMQQMSGLAPQGGYMQASPAQKTMMVPAGGMQPMMPQQAQSGMAPPGAFQPASPMSKTIVAGMMPPQLQPQPPQQQPYPQQAQQPQYPSAQGTPGGFPQPQQGPGPNKTVALHSSEGIVSIANRGGVVPTVEGGKPISGASTAFWIVSMLVGILIGVLGYVIVLQAS